ncbi:MAG: hypothetical protein WCN95_05285 [bacterium]
MPPDNKEHHFCFAYDGDKMQVSDFEALKFLHVQGTSTADGTQLVRVSLQKRNGRRAGTIPRIIDEYNKKADAPIAAFKSPITCFKLTTKIPDNPVLLRIELDKQTSRYWTWSSQSAAVKKTIQQPKHFISCIDQMILELKMDPSVLCTKSISNEIQAQYHETNGEYIGASVSPDQKAFVLKELQRFLQREKLYIVSPPAARSKKLDHHALAITKPDSLMDDLKFKDDDEKTTQTGPNDTILQYLRSMLCQWKGLSTVRLTSAEIADALSHKHVGLYRHTCVASFMLPFVQDGSVETSDNALFVINVEQIAKKIK